MADKKILIYDGTILANALKKNAARSGIFFAAYNIFKELLKRKDIELKLYCDPWHMARLRKLLAAEFKGYPLEILNASEEGYFISKKLYCLQKKAEYGEKKQKFLKTYYHFLAQINGVSAALLPQGRGWTAKLENASVFFSPVFAAPAKIAKCRSLKKFIFLYDTLPLIFPKYFSNTSWYKRLLRSINEEDFYFTSSQCVKQDFIKYAPRINAEHITVVPLAANLKYSRVTDAAALSAARKKYNIPRDKKYLLSVCTLEPRKNLIFAVRGFIAFIKKYNIENMIFVLGGASWESFKEKFSSAVEDLDKYRDRIMQTGYVDDADMNALYSGAEMFVYPSLYEGFGMPILEAMQSGVPVICSNTSSMPEVAGDAALLIDPKNDGQLVNAFEKIYFDPQLRQNLIDQGLERGKLFSWEKTVDGIMEKVNSLLLK